MTYPSIYEMIEILNKNGFDEFDIGDAQIRQCPIEKADDFPIFFSHGYVTDWDLLSYRLKRKKYYL